jgi:dTDP-4-dehydrorhamnose 3,5-epimerase
MRTREAYPAASRGRDNPRVAYTFTPVRGAPDALLIAFTPHVDERGSFVDTYRRSEFAAGGVTSEFVQDSHSLTRPAGAIRGLHYQTAPKAQGKLVRVIAGEIFDVVVDLRPGKAFGKWASVRLSEREPAMLWIPEGFAHGFQTLTADVTIQYKLTSEYSPAHERGVVWDDPTLAIAWPLAATVISEKDRRLPKLADLAR